MAIPWAMWPFLARTRARPSGIGATAPLPGTGPGDQALLVAALWLVAFLGALGTQYLPLSIAPAAARQMLISALLLNIALTLIGILRHRRLVEEIRGRRTLEARVKTLASHDPLTGLANRRSLMDLAGAAFLAAGRRKLAVAVLTINLDNFRTINEGSGHDAGDAVLMASADALRETAPVSATVARLGADEFACVMVYDRNRPHSVDSVAAAILAKLSQPIAFGRHMLHVTTSIGIARTEAGDVAVEPAIRRADIALSAAKKAGGDRACWFDAGMGHELETRNAIESGLRAAIPAGQIIPYYEQQIDLASGRLEGFEVLARWNHPTDGIIMPDVFIPIAEDAGLISDLSLSIMRQAFEHAAGWDPSLTLSVNISPVQLKDPWFAEKILKLLTEAGFPGNRLEIEITETALFDNLPLARTIVTSLKNQGVRVALDDFGTGYSSLAHLRALPFDRIKIDKSFVMAMGDDAESIAIVDAITHLGRSLLVTVTAEGVETAALAERLRALGCHKAQGWYYGRPLTIVQTRRLLADRALLGTARAA
ncbi:MAG TPA: EAL domain-containing protein [Sphingomonas sp.]|uniref:putative bifunctional diguanylate cyclase/phosphodiesterase n=1 Tax=Sphingomonas sp. TaxID=28214 RepID=UPI002ED86D06